MHRKRMLDDLDELERLESQETMTIQELTEYLAARPATSRGRSGSPYLQVAIPHPVSFRDDALFNMEQEIFTIDIFRLIELLPEPVHISWEDLRGPVRPRNISTTDHGIILGGSADEH